MAKKTHDELAMLMSKRFEQYNTKVLEDIADTIKQFKGLSYTEAHKLGQQLKYNKSYKTLINELSQLTGETERDVKQILVKTAKENAEFSSVYYKSRGLETPIYETSATLHNIVDAVANVSNDDFINISRNTGFRTLDENNNLVYTDIGKTYNNVIDECIYAVSTGQDTFDNVMRNTINQLAESGVRSIYYGDDNQPIYSQRLDTAVRRNILDSIRQINNEAQIQLGREFNADGVEITVHEYPAPDHADAQGRQFYMNQYNTLLSSGVATDYKGNVIDIRTYRKKGGFFVRKISQYNCYHTVNSVIVGVDDPLYSDEELEEIKERNDNGVEIDGKHYTLYEATQFQRQLETEIRKSKDAHIMFKKTDDKAEILKQQKRITQLTKKYNEITNKASIPSQLNRARVSGYKRVSVKNLQEKNKIVRRK